MWKGKYSERLVRNKIQKLPEEYVVFNNLLFEDNEHSTQIDHIVEAGFQVARTANTGHKPFIKANTSFTIR